MKLNKFQRQHLADKLMDSGNIVLAGLVIGQIAAKMFDLVNVILGLIIYFVLLIITTIMRKGG